MNDNKFETKAIRIQAERSGYKEHSVPVFESSSFIFNSAEEAEAVFSDRKKGYVYSRLSNPNTDEFINKLCALEGTESGVAASSGMAAIFLGIAGVLQAGDHLIASKYLFGTTHLLIEQILPKWGISHSYINMNNQEELTANLLPTTKMIYVESPSNPGLEIFDLKWLGSFSKKHNLYLLIDNSFATPFLQNPVKFGADLIVHSATKFIDGQGRTIGGAILGQERYIREIASLSGIVGTTMSPATAWMLSKSLETLSVRMERHSSNALRLALFLENNEDILWVKYPYLRSHQGYKLAKKQMKTGGCLVTFELKGGRPRAMRFINALKLFSITSNLGDSRTTITHPSTTTHSKLLPEEKAEAGITEGMIRVSVGLEHIGDIVEDVQQAIKNSG